MADPQLYYDPSHDNAWDRIRRPLASGLMNIGGGPLSRAGGTLLGALLGAAPTPGDQNLLAQQKNLADYYGQERANQLAEQQQRLAMGANAVQNIPLMNQEAQLKAQSMAPAWADEFNYNQAGKPIYGPAVNPNVNLSPFADQQPPAQSGSSLLNALAPMPPLLPQVPMPGNGMAPAPQMASMADRIAQATRPLARPQVPLHPTVEAAKIRADAITKDRQSKNATAIDIANIRGADGKEVARIHNERVGAGTASGAEISLAKELYQAQDDGDTEKADSILENLKAVQSVMKRSSRGSSGGKFVDPDAVEKVSEQDKLMFQDAIDNPNSSTSKTILRMFRTQYPNYWAAWQAQEQEQQQAPPAAVPPAPAKPATTGTGQYTIKAINGRPVGGSAASQQPPQSQILPPGVESAGNIQAVPPEAISNLFDVSKITRVPVLYNADRERLQRELGNLKHQEQIRKTRGWDPSLTLDERQKIIQQQIQLERQLASQ